MERNLPYQKAASDSCRYPTSEFSICFLLSKHIFFHVRKVQTPFCWPNETVNRKTVWPRIVHLHKFYWFQIGFVVSFFILKVCVSSVCKTIIIQAIYTFLFFNFSYAVPFTGSSKKCSFSYLLCEMDNSPLLNS